MSDKPISLPVFDQRDSEVNNYTQGLEISPPAKKQISSLLDNDQLLRISIKGGGCTGLEYVFEIIPRQDIEEGDFVLSHNVVIDPISFPYINGSTLDYIEKLEGSYFSFKNPNALSECGCGKSFSATK